MSASTIATMDERSNRRLGKLVHKMAFEVVSFMRTGTRASPTWPGAECSANRPDTLRRTASNHQRETACGPGAGHTFLKLIPCRSKNRDTAEQLAAMPASLSRAHTSSSVRSGWSSISPKTVAA